MHRNRFALLATAILAALACLPSKASAAYDLSGRWLSSSAGGQSWQWDVQQVSGEIFVTEWGAWTWSGNGLIDEETGEFVIYTEPVYAYPLCGQTYFNGSVAGDSKTFETTYSGYAYVWVPGVEPHGGHYECRYGLLTTGDGTRCGNEQIDDGEVCDDGNGSGGDCCTAACTLGTDGTACLAMNRCGTGTCTSGTCVPSNFAANGQSCVTGLHLCIDEVCDGSGSCGGSDPAAAGTRCEADTNPCTNDSCDAAGNCLHPFNTARCTDDGDPCTTDQCDGAGNCAHPFNTAPCTDDGDPCTIDVCDGAGNCSHPFNTAPCASDGDACTTDVCNGAGACVHPFNTAPCPSDHNVCTQDICDGAGSCTHVNMASSCDTDCGYGQCSNGSCVIGTPFEAGTICNAESSACTPGFCDGAGSCITGDTVGCGPCATCDGESCVADAGDCDTAAQRMSVSLSSDLDDGNSAKLKIAIKEDLDAGDLGDPTAETDYTLCLNRLDIHGVPRNVAAMSVTAGDGWSPSSRGFLYKDSTFSADGISSISMDTAKGIKITGKGPNLPMSQGSWNNIGHITSRIIASDGVTTSCWSHEVSADLSSVTRFKGKYSAH